MDSAARDITVVFTDIEGSTRLWETQPERMSLALASHDAIVRSAIEAHGGALIKMTGDGACAAFIDATDAVRASLAVQRALSDPLATEGLELRVRCGLHRGAVERRDGDFFGPPMNRAARIMTAAHGGQVLVSEAVVEQVRNRLPEDVKLRDLGKVRLKDLTAAEHLFQLLDPALRQDFPALRSLEAVPNNLPQQLTSFIGRKREIAEVLELVAHKRLVTLLGMGGVGKTRLSLQVGAEVIERFPDGVWFVDLAPIDKAALVVAETAKALSVREEGNRTPVESLCAFVKDRALLLIVDNCEHVVQACAELAQALLSASPRLRMLATSREVLRVPGETIYSLLPLPPPGGVDMRALAQSDAALLFVDRARLHLPAYVLDAQDAPAVSELCRRLEGIPLALELAAARMRTLGLAEINERLRDRFKLLTGGGRALLERQQTLRALVDWSYDLLVAPERLLFERLSIFVGGFDLDACESVCGVNGLVSDDVLDLLTSLVDKSLVVAELLGNVTRYRMLETIREYARARLADSDEGGTVSSIAEAHARYFHGLLQQQRLRTEDDLKWFERIDHDLENVRVAWHWSVALRDAGVASASARALAQYCDQRGRYAEGLALMLEARDIGAQDDHVDGIFLSAGSHMLYRMARYAEAYALAADALGRPGSTRDVATRLQCLLVMAGCALQEGRYEEARRHYREAQQIDPQSDPRRAARLLDNMALVEKRLGNYAESMRMSRGSLAELRQLDDVPGQALCLNNLAELCIQEGEFHAASEYLHEGLALCEGHGLVTIQGFILCNLAWHAVMTGDFDSAEDYANKALELTRSTQSRAAEVGARLLLVCIALHRKRWTEVRIQLRDALAVAIAAGYHQFKLVGIFWFGELQSEVGDAAIGNRLMQFVVSDPSISVPDRDYFRKRLQQRGFGTVFDATGSRIDVDDVAARIVGETDVDHGPLIASLRAVQE